MATSFRCGAATRASSADGADAQSVAGPGTNSDYLLTARSPSFRRTLEALERYAPFERVTLLLEGEPGTGKTSLARFVHARSPRRDRPFHRVDLGAIDDALSASELFGHVPGAFTGATGRRHGHFVSADRGTLFLDEIGKASLQVQRRLLHAIENRELTAVGTDRPMKVDVRLIAATNVSLEDLVGRGEFLPDLLPRFGLFRVVVPPLRERRADIGPLAEGLVAQHAAGFGYEPGAPPGLHPELLVALQEAPWPGNVRELVSTIHFLLVHGGGADTLTLAHCEGPLAYLTRHEPPALRARQAVAESGSIVAAARRLGVSRSTIYRYLERDGAVGRHDQAPDQPSTEHARAAS